MRLSSQENALFFRPFPARAYLFPRGGYFRTPGSASPKTTHTNTGMNYCSIHCAAVTAETIQHSSAVALTTMYIQCILLLSLGLLV